MSSSARRSIERFAEYTFSQGQYLDDADELASDDESDDFDDPFEILARREERTGVPLVHMSVDHHD